MYNMLLGRPWLHSAIAVTSTLHWRLKFIFGNQLITIMAIEPITIFQETSITYIDANAFLEVSFHGFDLVPMIHNASKPKLAWTTTILMAAKEMLKFSYQTGQGLGAVGHGNTALIELPNNKGGFSLGYDPSHEELFQASRGKKRKCIGQRMFIPHIRATFPAPTKSLCQNLSRNYKMRNRNQPASFGSVLKSSQ